MATMITGADKICMIMLSNSTSAFNYMHCPQPYMWTMNVKARVKLDNKIIQILLCRPVLSCCCLVVLLLSLCLVVSIASPNRFFYLSYQQAG